MKTNTKRGTIKQILNRQTIYNLSDYARKLGKEFGCSVSKSQILTALGHMEKEGQLSFTIVGKKIVGSTVEAIA